MTRGVLYHYTDAIGLHGIISGKCLWATSILHLNDSTEFLFFREAALNLAKQLLVARGLGEKFSFDSFAYVMRKIPVPRFVFCLSSDADRLSQWRGYCPKGGGYSVGFNKKQLLRSLGISRAFIFKCKYGTNSNKAQSTLKGICGEFASGIENASQLRRERERGSATSIACVDFLNGVAVHAHEYKHPAFEEEREWRVVLSAKIDSSTQRKERIVGSVIVPYLEIPFKKNLPIPVNEVIVGPTAESERAMAATQEYLAHHGLTDVAVRSSIIPYRP